MAAKKESSSKQLPTGPAGDKKAALETALAQIEKQFGKGAVMKLGTNVAMQVDAISTGSLGLDLALGIGGLPRGRIIEVYGPESSGKTTLALHVLAEAQRLGGEVAFIDVEHALDPTYARALGVDIDSLLVPLSATVPAPRSSRTKWHPRSVRPSLTSCSARESPNWAK